MARAKKSIERSVIDVQAEGYAQYFDDPKQSTEDFISGIEWICMIFTIRLMKLKIYK